MSPGGDAGTNTVEQLLLKFGLDLSPLKDATRAIKAALEELNNIAQQATENAEHAVQLTGASLSNLKNTATQTAEASKKATEQQTNLQNAQLDALKMATAEAEKKRAITQSETAEIEKQISLLRQQQQAARGKKGGGEGEGGIMGGAMGKFLKGTLGEEMGGAVMGGAVGGVIGAVVMKAADMAVESVKKLTEAISEAVEESNRLVSVWGAFSNTMGQSRATEYLNQLEEATGHLVDQMTLMKIAMTVNTQGINMSDKATAQLLGDTVKLGKAWGTSSQESAQAFLRFLITGNTRALAMATGIQKLEEDTRNLAPAFSKAEEATRQLERIQKAYGERLKQIGEVPQDMGELWERTGKAIKDAFTWILVGFQQTKGVQDFLAQWEKWLKSLEDREVALKEMGKVIGEIVANWKLLAKVAMGDWAGAVAEASVTVAKAKEEAAKAGKPKPQETLEHMQWRAKLMGIDSQANQVRADMQSDADKAALQETQKFIEEDLRLLEEGYKKGRVLLEDYLKQRNELYKDLGMVKADQITSDMNAAVAKIDRQIADIWAQGPLTKKPKEEMAAETKVLEAQREKAIQDASDKQVQIATETQIALTKTQEMGEQERIRRNKEAVNQWLTAQKDANKAATDTNENRYATDQEDFETYWSNKRKLLIKGATDEKAALKAIADADKENADLQRDTAEQTAHIQAELQRQLDQMFSDEAQRRSEYIDKTYGAVVERMRKRLADVKAQVPGTEQESEESATRNLVKALQQLIAARMRLLDLGLEDNEVTKKQTESTKENTHEVDRLKASLESVLAVMGQMGNTLGVLGKGISTVFQSKFAQNLASVLGIGAGGLARAPERMAAMQTHAKEGATPAEQLKVFTTKLTAAVGAVGDFASALINAQSAISGGIGGATSGAGLGGIAGTLLSSSKLAGPIGQAVGAVVGGVMGAITGSKNAAVKRNIDALNVAFKNINYALEQNTNNVTLAIQQMQSLIMQARQEQAMSKKGADKYQQAIDQYNDSLHQLQMQQEQNIRDMEQQLAILRAPIGMQDFLGSLKDIFETYNKFLGSVKPGDIQAIADANEWLARSLDQYSVSLQQQFNQANMDAVNDAIKLNDLLYQRDQLILQINDDIRSVLTQGVLTRQATRAQTAGERIAQIKMQTDMQMEQLNAQIAATQYRVASEQQIFNLATTRIGLETQLVYLQGVQTDQDMQRITALQSIITQLQQGGPNIAALLGTIQKATLPTNGASTAFSTGNPVLDAYFTQAYNSRAALGYGNFKAQNL